MPLKIKKFVHLYRNETVSMIRCYVRSKVTGIPRRGLDPWPWNAPKLTGKLTMPSYGHASFSEEDTILATLLVAVTKCLADAIEGRKEGSLFLARGLSGCHSSSRGTAVGKTAAGHVASTQEAEGDEHLCFSRLPSPLNRLSTSFLLN